MSGRRVAVVGCGNWGRYIVRDLVSLGCEVSAVDRSGTSQENARSHGATTVVSSTEELPEVDGVVIASSTSHHASCVESVLDREVPVFVEKPLTIDVDSARRIVERAGDRVFVMHKWRYHPGVEMLATIARSGELGPVQSVRLRQVGWGNPHSDVDTIWILAPHCLSVALAVLGELPRPVTAKASIDEETGFAHDMVAILGGSSAQPHPSPWVTMEVSARSPEKVRDFRVLCRDGVAALGGGYDKHIEVTRAPEGPGGSPEPQRRPISDELPLLRELREFVEHVDGGPPPRCSAAEGLAVVETIAALRELAGLKETVRS